jgi:hypothetical protein
MSNETSGKDLGQLELQDKALKVARDWKLHWMNKEGEIYFRKAFEVDSNMVHDLAKCIREFYSAEVSEHNEIVAQLRAEVERLKKRIIIDEDDFNLRRAELTDTCQRKDAIIAECVKALAKYANPYTHSMDERGFVWSGDYFDYETARDCLAKVEGMK